MLEAEESERRRGHCDCGPDAPDASNSPARPTMPAPRPCTCATMRWPPPRSGSPRLSRLPWRTEGLVATVGKVDRRAQRRQRRSRDSAREPRCAPPARRQCAWPLWKRLIENAQTPSPSAAALPCSVQTRWTSRPFPWTSGSPAFLADAIEAAGMPAEANAQRRRPRRHGDGRPRAHGHAVSAQPRRHQPPSRRSRASKRTWKRHCSVGRKFLERLAADDSLESNNADFRSEVDCICIISDQREAA